MDYEWNVKQTKTHLEMLRKAQSLLRSTETNESQLRALIQINTLESFLEATLKGHEAEVEFEKKRKELKV